MGKLTVLTQVHLVPSQVFFLDTVIIFNVIIISIIMKFLSTIGCRRQFGTVSIGYSHSRRS